MDRYDLMWITQSDTLDRTITEAPTLVDTHGASVICETHDCTLHSIDVAPLDSKGTVVLTWTVLSATSTAIENIVAILSQLTHDHVAYWNLDTEEQLEERLAQQVAAAYPDLIATVTNAHPWTFGPSISGYTDDDFDFDSVHGTLTVRSNAHIISIGVSTNGDRPILQVPRPNIPIWEARLTHLDDILQDSPDHVTVTAPTLEALIPVILEADHTN